MLLFADSTPIWPAIWAAIAATFSCIAAITLMKIHLSNREDSVRPEIILDGWSFETDEYGCGKIRITAVHNEGRGPVLYLRGQVEVTGAKTLGQGGPFAGFFYEPIPFLGIGKEQNVDWYIRFQWKGSTLEGTDIAPLLLTIFFADLHGRLHETKYELAATGKIPILGCTNLSGGLNLMRRYTVITPSWRLRLWGHKNRLIGAVRKIRDKLDPEKLPARIKEELEKYEWWKKFLRKEKFSQENG